MELKKAFFISGGVGRVLCSFPALEWYKENVDPDVVIVSEAWSDLFLASKTLRNNVWPVQHKNLFQEKIKDKEIITPEPYRLNSYFNQRCNLIQAFDIIINDLDRIPETKPINLNISRVDEAYGYGYIEQVRRTSGKRKVVIFQPFGSTFHNQGEFFFDTSGRSFNLVDMFKVTEKLTEDYAVVIMNNIQIPPPSTTNNSIFYLTNANLLQWMGIIDAADYFLGCDSMGQHFAYALNKPTTVVIGATYPENVTYTDRSNFKVIDVGLGKRKYIPMRITQDIEGEKDNEEIMTLDEDIFKNIVNNIKDELGVGEKYSSLNSNCGTCK